MQIEPPCPPGWGGEIADCRLPSSPLPQVVVDVGGGMGRMQIHPTPPPGSGTENADLAHNVWEIMQIEPHPDRSSLRLRSCLKTEGNHAPQWVSFANVEMKKPNRTSHHLTRRPKTGPRPAQDSPSTAPRDQGTIDKRLPHD